MFGFQHSLRNAGGGGAEAEARSSISPLFNSRGSLRFSREVIMLHSQVGASLLRNPLFPGRFFLFFFFGEWWKAGVGCLSQVPTSPLSLSLSLFAIFIQLVPNHSAIGQNCPHPGGRISRGFLPSVLVGTCATPKREKKAQLE